MLRKSHGRAAERKALPFEFKMVDQEAGIFEGYAAVFGNVDAYGDVIQKGAFAKTLAEAQAAGRKFSILWQHDPSIPIGACDARDMEEDDVGLKIKRGVLAMGVQKANEARTLMQLGALGGLSIGYCLQKGGFKKAEKNAPAGAKRILTGIDLWEFSPVTFPANTLATIGGVKAADMETVLDFNERRSELYRRRWRIGDALDEANHLALEDANLTAEGKIAAITANLSQFSTAMIKWYTDFLALLADAETNGMEVRGEDGPEDFKDLRGLLDEVKAGKTLSAATRKQIDAALSGMKGASDALGALIKAADTTPTEGDPPKHQEPESKQKETPSAPPDAPLERMRQADLLAKMKAAR